MTKAWETSVAPQEPNAPQPDDASSLPSPGRGIAAFLKALATRRITHPFSVGIAVYGALYELARRLPDSAEARSFFGNAGLLPISALVFALALRLRSHTRARDRDVPGLASIGFALLALFASDVGRLVVEDFPASGASHLWIDVPSAAAVLLVSVGLLRLAGGLGRGVDRLCLVLDVLTVMTTAIVLSAHYVVHPQVAAGATGACTLLCPIGDLATLLAVSVLVLRRPPDVPKGVVVALATAIFTRFVGQGAHAALDSSGFVHALGLADTVRLVVITAFAVAIESRTNVRAPVEDALRREQRMQLHPLPYVAAGVAYVVLIAECWAGRRLAPWDLAVGAAAVTIAVVARQVLAVRENATLWRERATLLGEARLSALVRHSTDAVWILDADGQVKWASPSSLAVLGRHPEELVGRTFLETFAATERDWARSLLGQSLASPRNPVSATGRVPLAHRTEPACIEFTFTNLLDEPHVDGVVANLHDVTARERLEGELSRRAFHDGLTGLANRSLFQDRVEHALARCLRSGRTMAVCLVDLDHFKTVNDGLGHSVGDSLLIEVALRLKAQMRDVDTIARLGGDEFAILVEDLADQAAVSVLSERIGKSLHAPFEFNGREVRVTASVGVALASPTADCEELLRNADTAMYVAKSRGRDTTVVFEPAMHEDARDSLELQHDLRGAIERGEIRVHYQPIVRLSDGAIAGFEALARWTHPTRGDVPPSQFIPLAESTGLIVPLGRAVLASAMRELRGVDARLDAANPPMLFVNVSARQFEDENFVPWLRDEVVAADFDPRRLCIELTESLFVHRTDKAQTPLEALRALGMKIGIDDFGTGYSSLSYLHRLPLDVLKIPREFVERLGGAADDSILAQSIVALAAAMNLRTIGEGIETVDQLRALRGLGCELGQGYLLARPGPLDRVLDSADTITTVFTAILSPR